MSSCSRSRSLRRCSRGAAGWSRCWRSAAVTWFGLFTTAGTPREIVGKINAEVHRLFGEGAFRERFIIPYMYETMTSSPEQFADFVSAETQRWGKVLRDANMKVD
jgi:tripartite-type tricarboxylate transporter receptor subunit TctC